MQKEFTFYKNYREKEKLREAFFQFTPKALYGADFRLWYQLGFWENSYIPYSFFKDEIIVSNASVCEMKIILNGQEFDAVQLATVGTLPEYQHQGLSRKLIEHILEDYKSKTSFFFLFGNENVLDFYPKFGFRKIEESCFVCKNLSPFRRNKSSLNFQILNVNSEKDRILFRKITSSAKSTTNRFGVIQYEFILSFYWIYVYPENFYYFPENDSILVLHLDKKVLWIYDILCRDSFSISKFLLDWNLEDIEEIRFGFCPDRFDLLNLEIKNDIITQTDSPLFVKGFQSALKSTFLFPMLARA